jgi:hypothetical protein
MYAGIHKCPYFPTAVTPNHSSLTKNPSSSLTKLFSVVCNSSLNIYYSTSFKKKKCFLKKYVKTKSIPSCNTADLVA